MNREEEARNLAEAIHQSNKYLMERMTEKVVNPYNLCSLKADTIIFDEFVGKDVDDHWRNKP